MSFKEALATLPKDTRISLDTTGSLTINGHTRDEFVAHGCPYKPIDDNGNMWVIYGIVSARQIRVVSALKKFPYKKSAQQIGDSAEQKIITYFFF